jgi:hypothetical protein
VQAAKAFLRLLDHAAAFLGLVQVSRNHQGFPALLADQFSLALQVIPGAGCEDHIGAQFCHGLRQRGAQAARRPGDDYNRCHPLTSLKKNARSAASISRVKINRRQAERAGFEPAVEVYSSYNRLAGGPIRPLWHLSNIHL